MSDDKLTYADGKREGVDVCLMMIEACIRRHEKEISELSLLQRITKRDAIQNLRSYIDDLSILKYRIECLFK